MQRIKERIETSLGVQWVTGYSRTEIDQKKRAILEEDIRRTLQLQVKAGPLLAKLSPRQYYRCVTTGEYPLPGDPPKT